MKKNLENTLTSNLKKMLKQELAIVWLTSDDKKFLCIDDALNYEEKLEKKRAVIEKEEDKMDNIKLTILKVLNRNNWGLYFKGEPITLIPTSDDSMVYKVNEVELEKLTEEVQAILENNCQEDTQENQTGNWSSNG